MIAGVDTGGTFTDAIDGDGHSVKVLSTPHDPAQALRTALAGLGAGDSGPSLLALLAHGTTVATNALLEGHGAPVTLITTAGFADVIEIARQHRPSLYDPFVDRPVPLVPRDRRLEVRGRLDPIGAEIEPLGDVPDVDPATAVAICLLHSDRNPAHERAVAVALAARFASLDVTCSSDVSPEFREYERMVTAVVNAALRPACRPYITSLRDCAREVLVMTSAGGLIDVDIAAACPAALLLSGPAAGVRAAAAVADACGFADAVSFDMGGTSTDVCLIRGGMPEPAPSLVVGGYPVRLPALDIHTIGAGGGSIARVDPGGALAVGPQSAGADPGPACYGRGGAEPTVTDADLALGRIPAGATFGDLGALDLAAARRALDGAGTSAEGVIAVVDAAMEQAVRAVTVERGIDPRDLALVAFGGAGPLHACAIAGSLGMRAVIVPPRAGVLSALGLVCSPRQVEVVRSAPADEAEVRAAALEAAGGGDARVEVFYDCRYREQSHELTVASVAEFHDEHERRNGYARLDAPVEIVAVRARARRPAPMSVEQLPPLERGAVRGPAVVSEPDCTVWVPEGWTGAVGALGAWILTRS